MPRPISSYIVQRFEMDPATLKRLDETIEWGEMFHGKAKNYRKDGTYFEEEWKVPPAGSDGEVDCCMAVQREARQYSVIHCLLHGWRLVDDALAFKGVTKRNGRALKVPHNDKKKHQGKIMICDYERERANVIQPKVASKSTAMALRRTARRKYR